MKKQILLVHIDKNAADSLDFLFSSMGFETVKVSNSREAADVFKGSKKPDLVITDVRMEESQLNSIISEIEHMKIPVIVFTEERLDRINRKLMKLKKLDIIKSFDDDLYDQIDHLILKRLHSKKHPDSIH